MRELSRLTSAEAAAAGVRLAILPVGSTEQHGPHLTVSTDTRIAEEFARRLAERLGDGVLLCPALPYGLSEHHQPFAGTVTLAPPAYMELLLDLLASLRRQGIPRVLVVNGHGGNLDALRLVVRRARSEHGLPVASMMWTRLAADVMAAEAVGPSYGHACELETSVALALAPDCVREERIRAPEKRPDGIHELAEPPNALVDTAVWFDEITADGSLGDPRAASRELGHRIVATALERGLAFARTFADME